MVVRTYLEATCGGRELFAGHCAVILLLITVVCAFLEMKTFGFLLSFVIFVELYHCLNGNDSTAWHGLSHGSQRKKGAYAILTPDLQCSESHSLPGSLQKCIVGVNWTFPAHANCLGSSTFQKFSLCSVPQSSSLLLFFPHFSKYQSIQRSLCCDQAQSITHTTPQPNSTNHNQHQHLSNQRRTSHNTINLNNHRSIHDFQL